MADGFGIHQEVVGVLMGLPLVVVILAYQGEGEFLDGSVIEGETVLKTLQGVRFVVVDTEGSCAVFEFVFPVEFTEECAVEDGIEGERGVAIGCHCAIRLHLPFVLHPVGKEFQHTAGEWQQGFEVTIDEP